MFAPLRLLLLGVGDSAPSPVIYFCALSWDCWCYTWSSGVCLAVGGFAVGRTATVCEWCPSAFYSLLYVSVLRLAHRPPDFVGPWTALPLGSLSVPLVFTPLWLLLLCVSVSAPDAVICFRSLSSDDVLSTRTSENLAVVVERWSPSVGADGPLSGSVHMLS